MSSERKSQNLREVNPPVYIMRNSRGSSRKKVYKEEQPLRSSFTTFKYNLNETENDNRRLSQERGVLRRQFHRYGGESGDYYNTKSYSNKNDNYAFYSRGTDCYRLVTEPIRRTKVFTSRPYNQNTYQNDYSLRHKKRKGIPDHSYNHSQGKGYNYFQGEPTRTSYYYPDRKSAAYHKGEYEVPTYDTGYGIARIEPTRNTVGTTGERGSLRHSKGEFKPKFDEAQSDKFPEKKGYLEFSNYCSCGMKIIKRRVIPYDGPSSYENFVEEDPCACEKMTYHQGPENQDNYSYKEISNFGGLRKRRKSYEYS